MTLRLRRLVTDYLADGPPQQADVNYDEALANLYALCKRLMQASRDILNEHGISSVYTDSGPHKAKLKVDNGGAIAGGDIELGPWGDINMPRVTIDGVGFGMVLSSLDHSPRHQPSGGPIDVEDEIAKYVAAVVKKRTH